MLVLNNGDGPQPNWIEETESCSHPKILDEGYAVGKLQILKFKVMIEFYLSTSVPPLYVLRSSCASGFIWRWI